MYAKKIQIENYGPIDRLEIAFPFNGDNPKPVLLVGENGSGKSILLSHIVNGLMSAQGFVYPENSEMQHRGLYKILSTFYIKSGSEYSYAEIEFEQGLYVQELILDCPKENFSQKPSFFFESGNQLWESMPTMELIQLKQNVREPDQKNNLSKIFQNNCILHFPPDRFQEPAWLNEESLENKAEYTTLKHMQGYTNRKIIQYAPLRDNQNWLLDLNYDYYSALNDKAAMSIYGVVLSIIHCIFQKKPASNKDGTLWFEISKRWNRKVSLMQGDQELVPNIFQLSSGETSLLNLFLSIIRDFDLTESGFTKIEEIRGIVVVDEIDLHLHADHQHKVLPTLMKMFPRVQFIVTTHSPLFILGMQKTFGEGGFALYRLPQGQEISPEEFSEFGNAYRSFTETKKFNEDIQQAIENAQKPIVLTEGKTNVEYLRKAATLLGQKAMLLRVELRDGGGWGDLDNIGKGKSVLDKIWKNITPGLSEIIPQKIILLYDCDKPNDKTEGNVIKRNIPEQKSHPLKKGIENLFNSATIERARKSNPDFIKTGYEKIDNGIIKNEEISINDGQKTNFCNWLCENGTPDDFKHFQVIFNLLREITASESTNQPPQSG